MLFDVFPLNVDWTSKNLPQAIYSSELLGARRGTAIYQAAPIAGPGRTEPTAVRIGDVGYIRAGMGFFTMFQASEPLDEGIPWYHLLRPTNFVPIEVGPVQTGTYPAGLQWARNFNTSLIHDPGNSSSLVKEGTVMRFTPTADRGAALFTKYRVWRSDVVDEKPFADYMLKNYKFWIRHCAHTQGRADMMFVTGVDLSTYYTSLEYSGGPPTPWSDLIITDSQTRAHMSVEDGSWREWAYFSPHVFHNAAPYTRLAADAETDEYLQHLEEDHESTTVTTSLFIRALRVQPRRVFPDTIKWVNNMLGLYLGVHDQAVFTDADPLQPLADYIFSHSIASWALFGDNDIKQLLEDLRPDENLHGLLKRLRPRVRVDSSLVGRIDPTFPVPKRWYSPQKVRERLTRRAVAHPPTSSS
ncbi:hypothetical protein C8R46DRAFT_1196116 [Mycena filopes]|nr:hypothetical protein C8R46DRAFT_1196116 [Mycena filopes]